MWFRTDWDMDTDSITRRRAIPATSKRQFLGVVRRHWLSPDILIETNTLVVVAHRDGRSLTIFDYQKENP